MRPYLRAANITWSGLDLADVKTMNFDDADFHRFSLTPGDVLLNEGSGSAKEVGKAAIWRGEIENCCFQNTLLRVKPGVCSSEYLARYFQFSALTGKFVSETQGVNIFHIGKDGLAKFPIPIPPATEQRRIVAKLDVLTARTARARADLARVPAMASRYRLAILETTFGNVTEQPEPLIDLVDPSRGIPYGIVQTGEPDPNGVPTVRCGDLKAFRVDKANLKLVTRSVSEAYSRTTLRGGEVLLAIRGSVGNPAVAGPELEGCNISREVAMIPVTSRLHPAFLMYFLGSPGAQAYLKRHVKGVAQTGINLEDVRSLTVPVPDLDCQEVIVRKIEAAFAEIDRLVAEAAAARRLLDRLDQAILAKAFRGELVPQDPADEPASVLLERIRAERSAAPATSKRGRKPKAA